MNIPIVISFNNNFTIPAGVCLSSMCTNANINTHYNVYVLFSNSRLSEENQVAISKLEQKFNNISIKYIDVEDAFDDSYEVRNVTIESYYRLLIPQLLPNIDKVLYIDVDTVINSDLTNLYNTNINPYSIAGVPEFTDIVEHNQERHIKSLGLDTRKYFNAGVLLFNLINIRESLDIYQNRIKNLATKKFLYQDQDILNIIFKKKTLHLSHAYNYTFSKLQNGLSIHNPIIIHYTLEKPWNTPRPFGDIWWLYYKKSILFDEHYYQEYLLKSFQNIEINFKIGKLFKALGGYKVIALKNFIYFNYKKLMLK